MQKKLFIIIFFICFGMASEIFFTAIVENIFWDYSEDKIRLKGHTYVWMVPIYTLIPFTFPLMLKWIGKYHVLIRSFIYMVGIFIIEFISGFILDTLIGFCPWDYTGESPYEIMGYIRLDFFPFWMFFGIVVEKLLLYLQEKIQE